jgi:hypothetical protein
VLHRVRLTLLWLALVPQVAVADSWELPDTYSVPSRNKQYRFRVHPSDERNSRPIGILYRARALLPDRRIWTAPLINRVGPAAAMVSDSGRYVVTLDDWRQVGTTPSALVIYDSKGELIAQFALGHLATPEEISQMFKSMSGVWWVGDANFVADGEFLDVTLKGMAAQVPKPDLRSVNPRAIRIRLKDGKVASQKPDA